MTDLCPDCPLCGRPPVLRLPTQAFCGNDECRCVVWDPTISHKENVADFHEITLTDEVRDA